jgi:sodium bicarbonate transporter 10
MLVVMIVVRKLLDFVFSQRELKILDDVMPESTKRNQEEEERRKGEWGDTDGKKPKTLEAGASGNLAIPLANGNVMKIPLSSVNITEEVNRTGIWKTVNNVNAKEYSGKDGKSNKEKSSSSKDKGARKRGSKKDALSEEERRRLSTMCEEEEDEPGITIKVDHAL